MTNPLLTSFSLPPFSAIKPEHVVPAVTKALADCRAAVEGVVAHGAPYSWENLCQPLAEADDVLGRIFSPISHLNSVKNSPELREAYEQTLPLLSEYSTWVGQHEGLYNAYRDLRDGDHYATLNTAQKKAVDNALRDFELSGIGLPKEKQQRYGEIATRLSELGNQYSNNVLDATMGWTKLITDEAELAGMPESALAAAKAQAEAKEQEGYLLTLDIPSYLPVMTYCDNQALREEMYRAYSTRASDQGPNAGKWDNSPVMEEILALRHELAQLLGFENYAHESLATKMAENPQQVLDFLTDLAKRARPQGEKELAQLRAFAKAEFGVEELQPWDIAYYSEKQKQHLYSISDEQLRPYFPENKAVNGLFEVVKRIYGITAKERTDVDVWHPEVRFFELYDENNELRGSFYLDLYAREHKRGGAWMDDCVGQMRKADGTLQKPVAYLTCNFNRPVNGKPALFTHDEVITLFHEFGHGLHHMLTRIETAGVSGISGVPWDAVELPSQFMETGAGSRKRWRLSPATMKPANRCRRSCWIKCWRRKTIRRRCLFCVSWSSVCLISVCMRNLTRSKGRKFLRRSLKLKNRSPWCRHRHGAASHMHSAISLLAAMRQATTAICGPTYWRRTRIPALRRKAFSTVRPVSHSLITS
ncbi:oligopeptidase A [Salmonella enterica subsp. enterica serovar Montevideo str. CT_02035278]|nr:oligopeptidase A [Salmonella enterica subsp. enterica serovar Montevideo str. CT_02035278]